MSNREDAHHIPIYLLSASLKPAKPLIASWDHYYAGDKSTQILRDHPVSDTRDSSDSQQQAYSSTDPHSTRDSGHQSAPGMGVVSLPTAQLIRQEFELLQRAPSYGTQPH